MNNDSQKTVAFVGSPNVGKTSLLNHIAGTKLTIGNWSGTTVNKVHAQVEHEGIPSTLVDLPGTYSLSNFPEDERLTYDYILADQATHFVFVCDAGNLQRSLVLLAEVAILKKPTLVILNLIDEAENKGIMIDQDQLSERLGTPVLVTNGNKGSGLEDFWDSLNCAQSVHLPSTYPDAIEEFVEQQKSPIDGLVALETLCDEAPRQEVHATIVEQAQSLASSLLAAETDPFIEISDARFHTAKNLADAVSDTPNIASHHTTERIDSIITHPILGIPIFLGIMLFIFRATYALADPWIEWVGMVQGVCAGWVTAVLGPESFLGSFLAQGVLEGAGVLLGFVPILLILYLGLSILERSGLMARIAYLADGFMALVGLSGRSAIPLILGFGCNVPAVYATRGLSSKKERLKVALAVPFMACTARVAVFAVFIPLFFPENPSLVLLSLFFFGTLAGLLTAGLLPTDEEQENTSSLLELPSYRLPGFRVLWKQALFRTMQFVKKSYLPIIGTVVGVWGMLHIDVGEVHLYQYVSELLSPIFSLIGFQDWHLIGALFPGIIAKEVVVASLSVSYFGLETVDPIGLTEGLGILATESWNTILATVNAVPEIFGLPNILELEGEASSDLISAIGGSVDALGALSYLVFLLLYTPCVATVMAVVDEYGVKWGWFSVFYQLVVALAGSGLVYWLGLWLTS